MSDVKRIRAPFDEATARSLRAGDRVLITGTIIAARDAAHKRLVEALDRGEELPVDLDGAVIYYVGPSPARPGRAIGAGSVGPDVAQVETWLNGRSCLYCTEGYVTENFRFGPKETEGVRAAQERADLLVTGTVNEETWAALRAQSCECEEG